MPCHAEAVNLLAKKASCSDGLKTVTAEVRERGAGGALWPVNTISKTRADKAFNCVIFHKKLTK